ncbi:hypothetical protein [Actinoallomurus acanthiterrae]
MTASCGGTGRGADLTSEDQPAIDDTIDAAQLSDTDMARAWPSTAARVVLAAHTSGSSIRDTWNILVGTVGRTEAFRCLAEEIATADGSALEDGTNPTVAINASY